MSIRYMSKVLIIMLFTLTACTRVHHVQVGSIDNTVIGIPIEIVVKTVGIDAAKLTKTIENITQQGNQKNKKNHANISKTSSLTAFYRQMVDFFRFFCHKIIQ